MEKVGKILRSRLVNDIKGGLEARNSAFVLTYSSVSASQINDLRKELKRVGAVMYVSKNRLAKLALKESQQDQLAGLIGGQTAFIWSDADTVMVSKLLTDFSKKCKGIEIRGGLLQNDFLAQADVDRMASLPSREVLQAQLLQTILSPVNRLAVILNAKSRDLLSILKQLSEKKGGS